MFIRSGSTRWRLSPKTLTTPTLCCGSRASIGRLANRQLVVPIFLLVLAAPLAVAGSTLAGIAIGEGWGGPGALALAAGAAVTGAIGACVGAGLSVALGPPSLQLMLQTPEAAVGYTLLGPLVATLLVAAPVLGARIGLQARPDPSAARGVVIACSMAAFIAYGALLAITERGAVRPAKAKKPTA